MGAPIFTEAELRRAMKVAAEFSAALEVCPRLGVIRILAPGSAQTATPTNQNEDKNQCDEAFGL